MTSGEEITAVIDFYMSQGGLDALNVKVRKKAEFHLQSLANKAWGKAPWSWKRTTASTISLPADGLGTFSFPSNYLGTGTRGSLYVSGQRQEIRLKPIDVVMRNRQINAGTGSLPLIYGMSGQSALGVKVGLVYPINTGALTLILSNYDRTPPIIVDRPIAPTLAQGAAGAYTGTVTYRQTYVTADGETEGSAASSPITVASKKITVTLHVSPNPKVTGSKLYRTATGGTQEKLVATIADNVTTSYTDEAADGTLGVNVPTNATAITGLELFPSGYHESVFYDGLKARLMNNQGDLRDVQADQEFMEGVRDMWINSKEDRSRVVRTARYGASAYRQ